MIKRSAASPAPPPPSRPGRSSSRTSTTSPRGSTTPRSTSAPTPCSSCGTRAPRAARACPSGAQLPIPTKLLAARRHRHGADLRRAHERHRVRHGRPARRARVGRRRAARGRARRRPDRRSTSTRGRSISTSRADGDRRRRLERLGPPPPRYRRGYGALYLQHVLQADEGCDFDFLRARPGEPAEREPLGLLSGWVGGW